MCSTPFQNLALRVIEEPGARAGRLPRIEEVELTLCEYAGTVGIQQLLKEGVSL